MRRRTLCALLLVFAAPARADRADDAASGGTTLAERLTTGLKARAPADVAYCEDVARRVRDGRLPAELVDSTYLWALGRGRKYPLPAFREALRRQAALIGIRP